MHLQRLRPQLLSALLTKPQEVALSPRGRSQVLVQATSSRWDPRAWATTSTPPRQEPLQPPQRAALPVPSQPPGCLRLEEEQEAAGLPPPKPPSSQSSSPRPPSCARASTTPSPRSSTDDGSHGGAVQGNFVHSDSQRLYCGRWAGHLCCDVFCSRLDGRINSHAASAGQRAVVDNIEYLRTPLP